MKKYTVIVKEHGVQFLFKCQADNIEHAKEQAINAYPRAKVMKTVRSDSVGKKVTPKKTAVKVKIGCKRKPVRSDIGTDVALCRNFNKCSNVKKGKFGYRHCKPHIADRRCGNACEAVPHKPICSPYHTKKANQIAIKKKEAIAERKYMKSIRNSIMIVRVIP